MNPYFNKIIEDINNGKSSIDLSDSNLTDDNIKVIADLIKDNDTIEVLKLSDDMNLYNKNKNKYTYHFNITAHEMTNQYNNNIKNKITIEGYSYLLNSLKYNKSIHTLIINNYIFLNNLDIDNFINKLSEMLLINETITNLTINLYYNILDKTFINLCDGIKNHKIYFETLTIILFNFNLGLFDIFVDAIKTQKYLNSLGLSNCFCKNDKFIELIQNLDYIQNLSFELYEPLYEANLLIETLENKKYLSSLTILGNYYSYHNIDNNSLSKLLNTNKNIKKLGLYSYKITDNSFIQSIINSNLETLKIIDSYLQIDDIINIIQNNNTIHNLDISDNNIKNDFNKLFDILKNNENITSLDISYNDITNSKDLNSLNDFIKNNNTITNFKMYECIDLGKPENLNIFNSLVLNNTIHTFKVSNPNIFNEEYIITDEFIDKISNLIQNNNILNKLKISNNHKHTYDIYEAHPYDVLFNNSSTDNFYLNTRLLTDKQYNKINNAIKCNKTLIYLDWNEIDYKEYFMNKC